MITGSDMIIIVVAWLALLLIISAFFAFRQFVDYMGVNE
jgi:hypothetical protein